MHHLHQLYSMRKAIDEIQKCTLFRRINDTFNTRNGPFIAFVYDLLINSRLLMYHKGNAEKSGE